MTAAWGRVEASAKVISAGLWTMGAVSGTTTYSAKALPPWYMTSPNTSSPGRNDSTALPTASTRPATSEPRMDRWGRRSPCILA